MKPQLQSDVTPAARPAAVEAPRARRVLLALAWHELDHLVGAARYAREKGWVLRAVQPGQEHLFHGGAIDGVICQLHPNQPRLTRLVHALRVPKVEMSYFYPRSRVPRVMPDIAEAGRLAADHFLQNGFEHILFIGHAAETRTDNSFYHGIVETLARDKAEVTMQVVCWGGGGAAQARLPEHDILYDETSEQSRDRLHDIVLKTPKPVAAFVAGLSYAIDLHDTCRSLGIAIPEEVAIVTWTHHPAESELTDVKLSSVVIDYDRQAYEAAALLDRMMQGEAAPSEPVRVSCSHLVVRASSNIRAVRHMAVARALAFIAEHIADPDLSTKRIVAELGISRTHLYAKFREHLGVSIATYMKQARLERAKQLLAETTQPIAEVARACGYSGSLILSRTLQRLEGVTPREYRRRRREEAAGRE